MTSGDILGPIAPLFEDTQQDCQAIEIIDISDKRKTVSAGHVKYWPQNVSNYDQEQLYGPVSSSFCYMYKGVSRVVGDKHWWCN